MPTYAYACTACEHRFEVQQAFTDHTLTECPECTGRLRKVFNSVGIVFKGSGFYRTDSRGKDGSGSAKSDTSDAASTSDKKSEAAPSTSSSDGGSSSSPASSSSTPSGGSTSSGSTTKTTTSAA